MRAVLCVALVGLVACVGCGREPDAATPKAQPVAGVADPLEAEEKAEESEPTQLRSPQEKAIATIENLGGLVEVDKENGVVVLVDLKLTRVTDDGLVCLKGLANLRELCLSLTKITGAGLVHLKGMTKLEELDLTATKVTDAGLVHLKGLTKLEWLPLLGTKVTDAGLVHLKGLTKLVELNLIATKVTDAGLVHLEGLTELEKLFLNNTKVTPAGVNQLQQALPNCEITH